MGDCQGNDIQEASMKLYPRRKAKGYVTAYSCIIGSAEARRAGFIDEDGNSLELEKTVDEESRTITIRIKDDE